MKHGPSERHLTVNVLVLQLEGITGNRPERWRQVIGPSKTEGSGTFTRRLEDNDIRPASLTSN